MTYSSLFTCHNLKAFAFISFCWAFTYFFNVVVHKYVYKIYMFILGANCRQPAGFTVLWRAFCCFGISTRRLISSIFPLEVKAVFVANHSWLKVCNTWHWALDADFESHSSVSMQLVSNEKLCTECLYKYIDLKAIQSLMDHNIPTGIDVWRDMVIQIWVHGLLYKGKLCHTVVHQFRGASSLERHRVYNSAADTLLFYRISLCGQQME